MEEENNKPEVLNEEATNEDRSAFTSTIIKLLNDSYNNGVRDGSRGMCEIILDKLQDTSKPFMERINDVKRSCAAVKNIKEIPVPRGKN